MSTKLLFLIVIGLVIAAVFVAYWRYEALPSSANLKFEELTANVPEHQKTLMRCTKNGFAYYIVGVSGVYGGGESYTFTESGEQIYHSRSHTGMNDELIQDESKGTQLNFATGECKSLLR